MRPYTLDGAPLVAAQGEIYPLAGAHALDFGAVLGYARSFGLQSGGLSGGNLNTVWSRSYAGVRARARTGSGESPIVGLVAAYGEEAFNIDGPPSVQLPVVDYRFVRASADLRVPVGRFALLAEGGYLFVLSAGDVAERVRGSTYGGVEAAVGGAVTIVPVSRDGLSQAIAGSFIPCAQYPATLMSPAEHSTSSGDYKRALPMSIDLRAISTLALLLPTVAATVAACAGTLEDKEKFLAYELDGSPYFDGGGQVSCPDVPTAIIAPHCTIPGCHNTKDNANAGMLDLQAPNIFGRLVGKPAAGGPGILIDPGGDPTKSVLWEKLNYPPPFQSRMPFGAMPLDDMTISCVGQWITQSAHASDAGGSQPEAGSPGEDSGGGGPPDTGVGPTPDSGGNMPETGAAETGSTMEAGGGGVTFTTVYTTILSTHCLPCHATGGGKTNGKLDMSTQANAFKNLVGVAAAGTMCTGKGTRVMAGNSAMSLLVEKLMPTPVCGKQMPSGMAALPAASISQISAWIDSGAANN
jgi:hypothetical protein